MNKKAKLFYGYHFPMATYWENYRNGGFTQLSLDFSSRCNYKCDYCFNKHLLNKDEIDILSLSERVKLMEDAVELKAKTLVVPGTGEPTLDPYFMETIEKAHDLGLITVVYSNLTGKVTPEILRFMHERNVSIGIKLDSFSNSYFKERYHTTERNLKVFAQNLFTILEMYGDSQQVIENRISYRLIANMVLTKENVDEIGTITRFCEKNNLPIFVRPVKPVQWALTNPTLWKVIGNETGLQVPENELVEIAKKHNTLFSPSSTVENHCAIFSFGLTVKSNGDVQLCPDHHHSRGMFNIRRTPLREIIEKINSQRKIESGYCVMLDDIKH